MVFNFILPLRITQTVLALAVIISAGVYVSRDHDGTAEGGFMIFLPIFTLIALGYLVAAPLWIPAIHNQWAVLGVEIVTWILWLSGFAAMAARIATQVCDNTGDQLCGAITAAKAAVALGALEWLAFSGSLGLVVYGIVQNRRSSATDEEGVQQQQAEYGMQEQYQEPPKEGFQQQPQQQQQQPGYAPQPGYGA